MPKKEEPTISKLSDKEEEKFIQTGSRGVPGFEGLYEVDQQGTIRSIKRAGVNRDFRVYGGGIIKPSVNQRTGYCQVTLCKDNKKYSRLVHRIVAFTHLSNPKRLPQINHKDGNKQNNQVSNLEWSTQAYNMKHAYKKGLQTHIVGEQHYACRLSRKIVDEIRSLNISPSEISRRYGISYAHSWRIINNQARRNG